MEDVKKLLYAGCKKAALNYSKPGNITITEEVSKKFGKEKIAACYEEIETILANHELLEEYVDELILVNAAALRDWNNSGQPSCTPHIKAFSHPPYGVYSLPRLPVFPQSDRFPL